MKVFESRQIVDVSNILVDNNKLRITHSHVDRLKRKIINWNNLLFANSDNYSLKIMDGAKVVVCRLKNNPMNYTSVAYPTDEMHLPDWFKELPFDEEGMEEAVLDKKIQNVLGVTGWDLKSANDSKTLDTFFEF